MWVSPINSDKNHKPRRTSPNSCVSPITRRLEHKKSCPHWGSFSYFRIGAQPFSEGLLYGHL